MIVFFNICLTVINFYTKPLKLQAYEHASTKDYQVNHQS